MSAYCPWHVKITRLVEEVIEIQAESAGHAQHLAERLPGIVSVLDVSWVDPYDERDKGISRIL